MAIASQIEAYRRLRREKAWALLAADTGPETIAFLQTLLYDDERELPESVFVDRLVRLMNQVSAETVTRDMASQRVTIWRQAGYIVRSLTDRDAEPVYALSVGAFEAVRFISSQNAVRISPTESRLELLIYAFKKLIDDTDENVEKRVSRLKREKLEIDERIKALMEGRISTVSDIEVQAQLSDIFAMIEALDGDFLRVRDAFMELAERIHADVLGNEDTRGAILAKFFAGYDAVAESDAGRTFTAFYKFLMSDIATREIDELIEAISERPCWKDVEERRRDVVQEVQPNLKSRARETQRMMSRLAKSLRYFVQSREYQQNRRLTELINQTRRLALLAMQQKAISTYTPVLQVNETFASISSIGATSLFNPENAGDAQELTLQEQTDIDLMSLSERLSASEINYALLKKQIAECLSDRATVSLGEVLERFPARQGLASIVGMIHLALNHAQPPKEGMSEVVHWTDRLGNRKRGRLPRFIFVRGSIMDDSQSARQERSKA